MALTARHKALRFFLDHGGYSYDPATQTPFQGKWESARTLADAEERLRKGPYYIEVETDPEPWDGDMPYDGPMWIVTLWRVDDTVQPRVLGSLGGVAAQEDDPYLRVVAAELAAEYIPVAETQEVPA